jgi:hypothetical protein
LRGTVATVAAIATGTVELAAVTGTVDVAVATVATVVTAVAVTDAAAGCQLCEPP